jgi:hypothetical protein
MTTALEGGEGSASRPGGSLTPGKTRYPLYRRQGGPQGRSTGAETLASTGIQSPDRPARSQSLYRLSYPAVIWIKREQKCLWNEGKGVKRDWVFNVRLGGEKVF